MFYEKREREVGLASASHSTHVEARDHLFSFSSHRVGLPEMNPGQGAGWWVPLSLERIVGPVTFISQIINMSKKSQVIVSRIPHNK